MNPTTAPAVEAAGAHRRRVVRAVVTAVLAGIVLDVVVIALAAVLGGPGALPAALIGSGLALVISLPTLIPARFGLDRGPATFALLVMGTWLGKMLVLVVLASAVRRMDSLALPWVGVALLAGGLAALVTEAAVLLSQRDRGDVGGPARG